MEAVIDLVESLRSFRKRFVPWGVGDRIQAVDVMEKAATEIETLRAVLVRILSDESFVVNDGGYLVQSTLPEFGYDSINDRCINLSPAELSLVKMLM